MGLRHLDPGCVFIWLEFRIMGLLLLTIFGVVMDHAFLHLYYHVAPLKGLVDLIWIHLRGRLQWILVINYQKWRSNVWSLNFYLPETYMNGKGIIRRSIKSHSLFWQPHRPYNYFPPHHFVQAVQPRVSYHLAAAAKVLVRIDNKVNERSHTETALLHSLLPQD